MLDYDICLEPYNLKLTLEVFFFCLFFLPLLSFSERNSAAIRALCVRSLINQGTVGVRCHYPNTPGLFTSTSAMSRNNGPFYDCNG